MKVWTVAAFAKTPLQGNLAGVTLVDSFPSSEAALAVAAHLGHSETAFVKQVSESVFEIRWFTPKYEINLCGHATLATAFFLWEKGIAVSSSIQFLSKSGVLWASQQPGEITLNFPLEPTAPLSGSFTFDWSKALGGVVPKNVVEAFGALQEYLVELDSAEQVEKLRPDISEIERLPGNGIIVTARGSDRYDFVSRVFAPQDGIPEDPVTASAHCKLVHYWEERLGKTKFLAYQASERGGEILVERRDDRVFLTGCAVMVSENEVNLPI